MGTCNQLFSPSSRSLFSDPRSLQAGPRQPLLPETGPASPLTFLPAASEMDSRPVRATLSKRPPAPSRKVRRLSPASFPHPARILPASCSHPPFDPLPPPPPRVLYAARRLQDTARLGPARPDPSRPSPGRAGWRAPASPLALFLPRFSLPPLPIHPLLSSRPVWFTARTCPPVAGRSRCSCPAAAGGPPPLGRPALWWRRAGRLGWGAPRGFPPPYARRGSALSGRPEAEPREGLGGARVRHAERPTGLAVGLCCCGVVAQAPRPGPAAAKRSCPLGCVPDDEL
jgi:hypothetical protein